MEKRDTNEWDSKRVKVAEEKPSEEKPSKKAKPVEKVVPKTVQIRLLRRKNISTKGTVTGNMYSFQGAGSTLDVDERDAPSLLARGVGGTSCCSGLPSSPYFKLV